MDTTIKGFFARLIHQSLSISQPVASDRAAKPAILIPTSPSRKTIIQNQQTFTSLISTTHVPSSVLFFIQIRRRKKRSYVHIVPRIVRRFH